MPTAHKPKTTLKIFRAEQIAAAMATATPTRKADPIDWASGIVSPGGGVSATLGSLRKARGRNSNPLKEQVAIRLDPEVWS